jgi:hypothetical protein
MWATASLLFKHENPNVTTKMRRFGDAAGTYLRYDYVMRGGPEVGHYLPGIGICAKRKPKY